MRMMARWMAAVLVLLLWSAHAEADSWVPPQVETYYSANRQFRLTVHPRPFSNALAYFTDKVCEREPAGAPRGSIERTARAVMERRDGATWRRVWAAPLTNEVAPVDALVTDDGRFAVTFDNWHMMGHGDNVVAIHGLDGRLVRALGLTDMLPEAFVRALPRSVSSIGWRSGQLFSPDGTRLLVKVVVPSRPDRENPDTIDLQVDLADGASRPSAGPHWDAALAAAVKVDAANQSDLERENAAFRAPLLGPRSDKEQDWHAYLREAFLRVDPEWVDGSARTTVLRPLGARDYGQSRAWIRGALAQSNYESDALAFASPSQENLASVFAAEARGVAAGSLNGVRVYVAVGDSLRERFVAALAHTGARFIQLDPTKPIPQRPERLEARAAPNRTGDVDCERKPG